MADTPLRADSAHANSAPAEVVGYAPFPPIETPDDGSTWAKAVARLKERRAAAEGRFQNFMQPANRAYAAGCLTLQEVRQEEEVWGEHANAYGRAIDELLLTPAPTLKDAIFKLEIGKVEEVFDATNEPHGLIDCIIADLKRIECPERVDTRTSQPSTLHPG